MGRLIWLLLVLLVPSAHAQFEPVGPATDYVEWTPSVVPDSVRPGGSFQVVLDVTIAPPWKMYALDATLPADSWPRPYGVLLAWEDTPAFIVPGDSVRQSTPESGLDVNFDLTLSWFHDRARFLQPMAVGADAPTGSAAVVGTVRYQICNDDRGLCLPPTTDTVRVAVAVDPDCLVSEADAMVECEIDDAALDALFADLEPPVEPASPPTSQGGGGSGGLLGFLLLAIGAGLASLLTPCVFPMVPLTVSYFTKHADDRPTAVRMALAFGAAIVATFTGLGLIMALVVGAAGAQSIAANPWVNLFIAGVLILFALSLLGLFELRLPHGLVNRANERSHGTSGLAGVVFMGLTLTLVSFSCTAPFVGGLLAAAAGGTWVFPLAGMAAYSAAFAFPFVLLAVFPNALSSLPSAGGWMNVMKVMLGFIELAAAIKFLSNADLVWGWDIISRPLAIALTVVILFLAGLYLLGKLRLPHEEPVSTVGVGRLLAAIAFIAVSLYMLPGLFGAPLGGLDAFLPPRTATDVGIISTASSADREDEEIWFVDDLDGAIEEASATGRPVFVDFTGYTCTNCRQMEANVFPAPPIRQRFEDDFVLVRLYTDGLEKGPDYQRYQLGLTGTVALPTYVVLDPESGEALARESGIMKEDAFAKFLDQGLARFRGAGS